MPKQNLFDEDSEEENVAIKTENEYAKKYDNWREKEELHKLEQKYGSKMVDGEVQLSSDSEDDDDEPPEVTPEMETQFLKTLALLKSKDPRIYDPNYKFFDDEVKEKEEKPKAKTLSFADSDDDDDDDDGEIFKVEKAAPEPLVDVKKSKRTKSVSESSTASKDLKEEKVKDFLVGKLEHIGDKVEDDLAPLKALWSDPKLNEGEAFLRDYILNKRYLDDGEAGDADEQLRDDEDLEADEKIVEEQGKFERAYNFRFEEPDEEYLKRYPRTMSTVRPKDQRRAQKRAEVRTRKEEEKQRKMDEIARMKALKLKEIQEKIAKIKEVTGNEELAFQEEDIEGDFDPAEHDRRMKALFDEEYYGHDAADQHKPVFPELDEELEIENWDRYEEDAAEDNTQGHSEDGPHCEDDDFNMDADYNPKRARANLLEEIQKTLGTKKRRNRKKKSKLAELLTVEKPKFVPTAADKTYDQYMEEYYQMDCEDVIGGDLPTRFKYRDVLPNDYGLSVEEILLADDKELTQWVPLKRVVRARAPPQDRADRDNYRQKAADTNLKKKLLPSLFKHLPEEPEIVVPVEKKIKKKKKKNKDQKTENTEETTVNEVKADGSQENEDVAETITAEEDMVAEIPKKKKKKRKGAPVEDIAADVTTPNDELERSSESSKRKKKEKCNTEDKTEVNVEFNNKLNVEINNRTPKSDAIVVSNEGKKKRRRKKKKPSEGLKDGNKPEGNNRSQGSANNNKNQVNKVNGQNKLKRKLDADNNQVPNKKKKNKKFEATKGKKDGKLKNKTVFQKLNKDSKVESSDNPLSKLSDERLKAFGLNPKKYRSFLKYKKF